MPKNDRFTIYEKAESLILETIELIFMAGHLKRPEKQTVLETASTKLNMLRFFIRVMKDTKTFDTKKYAIIQEVIDEIGRMLGGWIRSTSQLH